jgi:hypothetical protein
MYTHGRPPGPIPPLARRPIAPPARSHGPFSCTFVEMLTGFHMVFHELLWYALDEGHVLSAWLYTPVYFRDALLELCF